MLTSLPNSEVTLLLSHEKNEFLGDISLTVLGGFRQEGTDDTLCVIVRFPPTDMAPSFDCIYWVGKTLAMPWSHDHEWAFEEDDYPTFMGLETYAKFRLKGQVFRKLSLEEIMSLVKGKTFKVV